MFNVLLANVSFLVSPYEPTVEMKLSHHKYVSEPFSFKDCDFL